ncbi:MAG: efflux RND transporter permease subunit [Rubripirellula sp.]
MNLADLAMRYRTILLTVVLLLAAWGAVTFVTIPRREDPEFTIRSCVINTIWPGAPTMTVEELVTDKLEEALDGIEEVERLRSTTINGQSTIYVDVEDNVPPESIQNIWDKVRAKVDLVAMPNRDVRPVVNDDFGDTAVLVLGIYQTPVQGSGPVDPEVQYSPRQIEEYADTVRDVMRLLPGVARVDKYGVQDEAIYIETDIGTWAQIDLTSSALRQLVESRNIVASGGSIDTPSGRFSVHPGGEFDAVSEIESIVVGAVQSGDTLNTVRLRDVGLEVKRAYRDPPEVICRFTEPRGTYPAVMLAVTMKSGSNIIDVCDRSMAKVKHLIEIDQALPRDISVMPVSNQSENVSQKIDDVISNVISAILIVVLVVLLFVGLRTSIVMAANIPIVVLSSIAVIALFGVQLEQISLASIIIALGLLVDNAVQVCDQTRMNLMDGMQPRQAAVAAAKTLMFPMLTGTLTTVAAFLPMLFALEGGSREYVYSLPVTLSTTLLLSWVLAMTICVYLAAAFIRAPANPDRPTAPLPWLGARLTKLTSRFRKAGHEVVPSENFALRLYGTTAMMAIRAKWVTVVVAVGILIMCMSLPVGSEFFPQDRRDQFFVNVILPETSTIEQTNAMVGKVERMIQKLSPHTTVDGTSVERIRAMRSMIGKGGARWALGVDPPSPAANVAEILVRTTNGDLTPGFIDDILRATTEGVPELGIDAISGARVVPKKLMMGPPAPPLVLRVSGDGFADIRQLRQIADQVKNLVVDQPETWDVSDSWGADGFQIALDINEQKANLVGVTNANVADTLNAYFSGLQLSQYREGDHQVPVLFRLKSEQLNDLSGIDSAYVEGQNGKLPLNSISSATPTWQPAKIERRDMNRTIEIRSEVLDGASGNDVVLRVMDSDRMKEILNALPTGYRIEIGGSLEESQDASVNMLTSFAISFLAIVMILVIQYNGWSKTLVILATLPLAMGGAFFGLWMTDSSLGFMPQLGLLSLFGIVLNTGIIFIEFADILIRQKADQSTEGPINGLSKQEFQECLVSAGKQRMLPIFLTTATTVGGLLPLALSGGPLWEGMAWLMITGLLIATLLTLYVVPALYAIVVETFGVQPIAAHEEA